MDEFISLTLNSYVGEFPIFDALIGNIGGAYFKLLPILICIWALWFLPTEDKTKRRAGLLAALLVAYPVAAFSRFFTGYLPFSIRPLYDPRFELQTSPDIAWGHLDGVSSMPSDHAAIFFAMSTAILIISRPAGVICLLHSLVAVAFTRIYFAWHWPSDILAGALLGIVVALVFFPILRMGILAARIIPFFEKREWIGYPLLFLASYEAAEWFQFSNLVISQLLSSN